MGDKDEHHEHDSTIVTVSELIDSTFGDPDVNTVNHKQLQAVLYLIARQLRLLERKVTVKLKPTFIARHSSSSISVTEVKLKVGGKTGSKTKLDAGGHGVKKVKVTRGRDEQTTSSEPTSSDKHPSSKATSGVERGDKYSTKTKTPVDKDSRVGTTSDRASTGDKYSSDLTSSSDKKSAGRKTESSKDSAGKATAVDKSFDEDATTITDFTSTVEKSSKAGKSTISGDKSSTRDKKSAEVKSSPGDQDSSDEESAAGGKASGGGQTSSGGKSTRAKKSAGGKSSPGDDDFSDEETVTGGKSAAGGKASSREKSSTREKKLTGGKSSPDDKESSTEETTTGRGKSAAGDKTSSGGKSSTRDKKSTGVKSSPDDRDSSDEESTAGGISVAGSKASGGKSIRDKKSSAGKSSPEDQSLSEGESATRDRSSSGAKSSTRDKTSTPGKGDRTLASDKTSKSGRASTAGRRPSADETSIADEGGAGVERTGSGRALGGKSTTGKSTTDKSGRPSKLARKSSMTGTEDPQACQQILDEVELMREKELRVIRQRADSREEHERTPTPIASLDSVEAAYEKLLVVERLPAEEAAARAARAKSGAGGAGPPVSVVTLEQFKALATVVHQIQQKLKPIGESSFPENIELMQELRKGASLTDAMAALQLSARLEATEKTLTNMLSLVTDMATQMPGYKPGGAESGTGGRTGGKTGAGVTGSNKDEIEVLFGAGAKDGKKQKSDAKGAKGATDKTDTAASPISSAISVIMPPVKVSTSDGIEMKEGDTVTYEELEKRLRDVEKDIMKQVTTATDRSIAGADTAKKLIARLEQRIDTALALGNRMDDLESLISNYAEQINVLDTGLSSQLTNYQEELTQMQHDLETGLENMAEVLANTGGDATAVAELNGHFNDLQIDIDDTIQRQNDLRQIQYTLSQDLDGLRRQIEMLRDAKSDRDEVADALRDKAGLSDLNGLISIQQFEAVIGDLEKRLAAAYDKFNNQEIVWQKAIDEVLRELNEKADLIQVDNLRDQINHYLELLRKRMQFILDIVGEPVAAALVRKINRDGACLSCSAPAHMEIEQTTVPNLPAMRSHAVGDEAPKGDGDHEVCYPGHPIRHPIDPRAHICNRWCGGSHTKINPGQSRVPPSFTITPLNKDVGLAQGTDGRMYVVDKTKEPCAPCLPQISAPTITPTVSIQPDEIDYENVMEPSGSLSLEMLPIMSAAAAEDENATPPMLDLQTSLCLK